MVVSEFGNGIKPDQAQAISGWLFEKMMVIHCDVVAINALFGSNVHDS